MGLLSNSKSITRYRVNGKVVNDESVMSMIRGALIQFRMTEIQDEQTEVMIGWVPFEKPYEPDFDKHEFVYGAEIVFSLRIDKKVIPSSALKQQYEMAIKKRLDDTGREFLSKTEKKEIRESIYLALTKQMPFSPKMYDAHWNFETGSVKLYATSKTVTETFESFFLKSFGKALTRLFPYTIAQGQDIAFVESVVEPGLDISHAYNKYAYLGSEFLLWLWYMSENDENSINKIAAMGDLHVIIFMGDNITIVNRDDDWKAKAKISIRGSEAGYKEAAMALLNGGKISEMNFDMTVGGNEFSFSVTAESLILKSLKTPATHIEKSEQDIAGEVLEKLHLDGIVFEIMDKLFFHFLGVKSSGNFDNEFSRVIPWLEDSVGGE